MKRIFQFNEVGDYKFKTVVNFLIDHRVSFNARYEVDRGSTIEFECEDHFYEYMLEEIPRIHHAEIEV